jgi:hypothetical protein
MLGNGRTALADSLDIVTAELEQLIDRHFAARRSIKAENTLDGRWLARTDHAILFPATKDLDTVIRFVRAFAEKNEAVTVDEDSIEFCRMLRVHMEREHSVRVPALRVVL